MESPSSKKWQSRPTAGSSRLVESLPWFGHFDLFEAIRDENGDFFSFKLISHSISPFAI